MPYFQLDVDAQYRMSLPQKQGIVHVFYFHLLVLLLVWSFVMTSITNPGYISEDWKANANNIYDCNERKKNGEFRFCKYEQCFKPDRAHYCRQLGRNVLKMDHYCPWVSFTEPNATECARPEAFCRGEVSNCVGFYNYKYFFQTLFYSNVTNVFMLYNVYKVFFRSYYDPNSTFNQLFYLSLITALIIIILFVIFPFTVFHLWLISINKTTIEFLEWKSSGSISYNRGLVKNFNSIFGSNILSWLFPVGIPEGDGIHFP